MLARPDHFVGDRERVYEAAADCLNIERCAALHSQLRLHDASRARKDVVGGRRSRDDEIDFLRNDSRRGKRRAARLDTQIAGGLRGFGDMTLADAGARPDPFVGGVHLFGQIVVGDDLRRQIAPGTDDARPDHVSTASEFPLCPNRSIRRCSTSLRTSSMARSMARSNPNTSAEPWLFTTMPFNPSRVAPLKRRGSR